MLDCGITNVKASVLRLTLSDGLVLQGTSNHPIFIEHKGFVPLAKSVKGDRLILWQNQNRLFLMASYLDGILNQHIARHGSIFKHIGGIANKILVFCTERFGNLCMGKFLKDTSFTIKTKIRLITTFLIWIALRLRNTHDCTYKMQNATPNGYTMLLSGDPYLANGRQTHWSDKESTVNVQDLNKAPFYRNGRLCVPNAPKSLSQVARPLNFALINADKHIGIISKMVKPLIHLSAYIVGRSKKHPSKLKNTVIQSVGMPIDEQMVYNLTVEGVPEYFANGILVHNYDIIKSTVCLFGSEPTALS